MNDKSQDMLLKHAVEDDSALRALVFSMTRSLHETEDLVQRIWLIVCSKIENYDDSRPFRPWLMGIARLELLKWRQTKARNREILSPEAIEALARTASELTPELDHRADALKACLDEASPSYRRIMAMKYVSEMKIGAIGKALGRSEAAVEMALVRARRSLRKCIEKKMTGS